MLDDGKRFRSYMMSFTFKERRARELSKYKQRVRELERMESDEIEFEYITLKSGYEHKKGVLTILLISVALAVLMNIWKYFFMFMEKALQYASSIEGGGVEVAKVSFAISSIIAVSVTFLILAFLITYMGEMYRMQKERMVVEEVRNKRSKK